MSTYEHMKALLKHVRDTYGVSAAMSRLAEVGARTVGEVPHTEVDHVVKGIYKIYPHLRTEVPPPPAAPTTGLKTPVAEREPPTVTIDIRGPVGVGKTAIAGAIHLVLRAHCFTVDSGKVEDIDTLTPVPSLLIPIEHKPLIVITETVERPKMIEADPPRDVHAEAVPSLWPDTAHNLLQDAANAVLQRAAERDVENERSMGRCVQAFNALTGANISERDGWLFIAVLKAARATATPTGRKDDYVDGAAYFGLSGESVLRGGA